MANRYFLNIGANWGDTANWSDTSGGTGGFSVPTNVDDVFFDANSGNCTVNATGRTAKTLNFTGYTNTITMTFSITVSGNVTLAAGMTIAGGNSLNINATANLTSNGKTWPNNLSITGIIVTLIDNWTIGGTLILALNSQINGLFNLYVGGGLTVNGATGTGNATIILNGTGTWSGTNALRQNLTIDTTGTITISGQVNYNTGTLTYTAGTVVTTGSTLSIAASTTLNTSGMSWNNVTISGGTTTLTSNCTAIGNFTISATCTINGLFTLNVGGNFTNTGGTNLGTATIALVGSGTWSGIGTSLRNDLILNPTGTLTITGTVYFSSFSGGSSTNPKTLTRLTTNGGTVDTGTSSLVATNCILNTNGSTSPSAPSTSTTGVNWYNINAGANETTTLTSDLCVRNTYTCGNTYNGFTVYVNGNLTLTNNSGGSTNVILNGTGTWSGNFQLQRNLTINTTGTITISGSVSCGSGGGSPTFTYTAGTVVTTGSTVTFGAPMTIIATGIIWNNVTFITIPSNSTATLSSDLNLTGNLLFNFSNVTLTLSGNNIYVGGNLTTSNGGAITGTTNIILNGTGTWSQSVTVPLRNNLTINTSGTITISGNVYYNTGTLTYTAGTVKANTATLNVAAATTFLNCDKINFKAITITAATTQTFNKFFSGSAIQPTRIQSSTPGSNYTIAFQDGFEKITKFTKISNCTVSNRGQLLCITDKSNKGGNLGVRYINQLPNGVPKNAPTVAAAMAYSVANISDPNFILN